MKIYLIGYLGRTAEELEAIVTAKDGILMDIRISAKSRKADFSEKRLIERFGDWYMWVPEFGNAGIGTNIEIDDPDRGIEAIEHIIDYQKASGWPGDLFLMCACRDGNTCHRRVVGELLREYGFDVAEYEDGI